ncbi:MAG: hypothetical protein ACXADC_09350 [Candidatus Thorarchaeota archaeon]
MGSLEAPILIRNSLPGESVNHLISSLGLSKSDLGNCYINGILAKPEDILEDGDIIELYPLGLDILCGGHLK